MEQKMFSIKGFQIVHKKFQREQKTLQIEQNFFQGEQKNVQIRTMTMVGPFAAGDRTSVYTVIGSTAHFT